MNSQLVRINKAIEVLNAEIAAYYQPEPKIPMCSGCAENFPTEDSHLCPLLARLDKANYRDHPCNCCTLCQERCLSQT
jgi:hypothetical protein